MLKKLRIILKDKNGVSFPLVVGVTLSLLLIFCGANRHFRLQVITVGVRDAVEDVIISTIDDNYAGVYRGVWERYSGGRTPYGEGEWEETLDEGNIYVRTDEILGTRRNGGHRMRFVGDSGSAAEFALTDLNATLCNAPLTPSDPENVQRFEVEAVVRLKVPVRFGRRLLPSMRITLWVRAGYIEVF